MTKPRYKNPWLQATYDRYIELAANRDRAVFCSDGSPNRGTPLSAAFWDGAGGLIQTVNALPRTAQAAAFAAGKQYAKKRKQ